MRIQPLLLIGALSVSLPLAAQPAPTPSPPVVLEKILISGEQPGPGLWKVSKDDHVLWLVGEQSPVPQKMRWRAKGIEAIVAQSKEILAAPSYGISAKQIGFFDTLAMLPSILQIRKSPEGKTLSELIPADLYARWRVLRDRYIDLNDARDDDFISDKKPEIESWRPLFAAQELYRQAIRKSGMTSDNLVWPVVSAAAKKHNVKITSVRVDLAVEGARTLLKDFRASSIDDIDCFTKTVNRIETDLEGMRLRANAWAVGDIAALRNNLAAVDQRLACQAALTSATFTKKIGAQDLLAQAEAKWFEAAEAALKNHPVALAVLPIGQMLSPQGYLAKLRAKGYRVEEPE
ncbi:MAG: TraB/GumN family protein [Betaproteobacteria bacterium]|nr:TraB/GumN family protein [Betaproteobacteria bacterium]